MYIFIFTFLVYSRTRRVIQLRLFEMLEVSFFFFQKKFTLIIIIRWKNRERIFCSSITFPSWELQCYRLLFKLSAVSPEKYWYKWKVTHFTDYFTLQMQIYLYTVIKLEQFQFLLCENWALFVVLMSLILTMLYLLILKG